MIRKCILALAFTFLYSCKSLDLNDPGSVLEYSENAELGVFDRKIVLKSADFVGNSCVLRVRSETKYAGRRKEQDAVFLRSAENIETCDLGNRYVDLTEVVGVDIPKAISIFEAIVAGETEFGDGCKQSTRLEVSRLTLKTIVAPSGGGVELVVVTARGREVMTLAEGQGKLRFERCSIVEAD